MGALLRGLVVKMLKGRIGSILPALFKAAAEGEFGQPIKRLYWWTSGKKTAMGAIPWFIGAGAETVCSNMPQFPWTCDVSHWAYWIGMVLIPVGLIDAGTRSPWPSTPDGQPPWKKEK